MNKEDAREVSIIYALSLLGKPAGEMFNSSLDFVEEVLKAVGMIEEEKDYSMKDIKKKFSKIEHPVRGSIIFFSEGERERIGICLNEFLFVEFCEGSKSVRIRPIRNRKIDCIVNPYV